MTEHEYDENFYYDLDDSNNELIMVVNNDGSSLTGRSAQGEIDVHKDNIPFENYSDSQSRAITNKESNHTSMESISFDRNTTDSRASKGNTCLDEEQASLSSTLIRGISSTFKLIEKNVGVPRFERLQSFKTVIEKIKGKVYDQKNDPSTSDSPNNIHKNEDFPFSYTPHDPTINFNVGDETQSKESIVSSIESIRYDNRQFDYQINDSRCGYTLN